MKGTFFTIATVILLLMNQHSFHKDKIARPTTFVFVFEDQDTITIPHTKKSSLDSICQALLENEKNLESAAVVFRTGERLTFTYIDSKLEELKITDKKQVLKVPKTTLEKLQKIHFETLALKWNGTYEKAFDANYLIIQFDTGLKQEFGKYSYVQLGFSESKFSGAGVWKPVSKNSIQWQDLK